MIAAARGGALAFGAAAVAGLVLGVLALATSGGRSVVEGLLIGGLAFLLFHHVTVEVATALRDPMALDLSVSVALMLGTGLVAWLLFRAGRMVGARLRGWGRLAGALVGVPYAASCLAVAFVVRAGAPEAFPGGLAVGSAALRPHPASALAWGLGLGGLFGLLGGMGTVRGADDTPPKVLRLVGPAVAGGWRMAWAGLALSFIGLLVLAGLHPGATRSAVDRAFAEGTARGVAVVVLTGAAAPNVATGVLSASMGGPIRLDLLGGSCTVLSYARFPEGLGAFPAGACGGEFTAAPAGYFLFLLVPAVATLAGGRRAARLAGAADPGRASLVGGAAGLAFGGMALGLMVLARVTLEASGPSVSLGTSSFGPDLLVGWLLASAWGVAGGGLGGVLAAGRATGPGDPGPSAVPR